MPLTLAFAVSLSCVFGATTSASAAEVSIPMARASAGGTVTMSVEYSAQGEAVSALNFDLAYDPNAFSITPTLGAAAASASKVLFSNVLSWSDGTAHLRIIIFGLNQTVIQDGSLVDLHIQVSPNSPKGQHTLDLVDLTLASPAAEAVPATVQSGRIIVTGGR